MGRYPHTFGERFGGMGMMMGFGCITLLVQYFYYALLRCFILVFLLKWIFGAGTGDWVVQISWWKMGLGLF